MYAHVLSRIAHHPYKRPQVMLQDHAPHLKLVNTGHLREVYEVHCGVFTHRKPKGWRNIDSASPQAADTISGLEDLRADGLKFSLISHLAVKPHTGQRLGNHVYCWEGLSNGGRVIAILLVCLSVNEGSVPGFEPRRRDSGK